MAVALRHRYRWIICALLFCATVINYIDRQTISVLKGPLQTNFGWSEADYGTIVFYSQLAYAVSFLFFGRFIDWIGARAGLAVAVGCWTLAHMAHAVARSLGGFVTARIALGVFEAGNFPAGLKAIADWFPQKERALAIGLFNAGANVGAIVTPLLVPAITLAFGWPAAFLATGLFGIAWLIAWLVFYRRPEQSRRLSATELAFIRSDSPEAAAPVSWRRLLATRECWAFAAAKFLVDPIWAVFLFWLPDFFSKRYGLDLKSFGPPLAIIYIMADCGSVAGGWFSSALIKRGWSANRARKTALLISALLVLPIMAGNRLDQVWLAVAIVGLATAAHQSFACNLYAMASDLFPRQAVATITGIGGTSGAIGGMLMAKYAGWTLDKTGSYTPIFLVAAFTYLVALGVIHLLTPRYIPARMGIDQP